MAKYYKKNREGGEKFEAAYFTKRGGEGSPERCWRGNMDNILSRCSPLALPRKANETLQVLERISGIPGISSPTIHPSPTTPGTL